MMLALTTMDPTVAGILFLIAVVLFILGALGAAARVNLVAAGLAFGFFVFMWNSFAAG